MRIVAIIVILASMILTRPRELFNGDDSVGDDDDDIGGDDAIGLDYSGDDWETENHLESVKPIRTIEWDMRLPSENVILDLERRLAWDPTAIIHIRNWIRGRRRKLGLSDSDRGSDDDGEGSSSCVGDDNSDGNCRSDSVGNSDRNGYSGGDEYSNYNYGEYNDYSIERYDHGVKKYNMYGVERSNDYGFKEYDDNDEGVRK